MSLRELATGWDEWLRVFYATITTASPLDWLITYFIYIAVAGVIGLIVVGISVFLAFHLAVEIIASLSTSWRRFSDEQESSITEQAYAELKAEWEREKQEQKALKEHEAWRSQRNDRE